MGKRKNQALIDSDSGSNDDSGSDLDSVKKIYRRPSLLYAAVIMLCC